jgi:CheY-like chemotaxis protein
LITLLRLCGIDHQVLSILVSPSNINGDKSCFMSQGSSGGVNVFISYSRQDRFIAETLSRRLREIGFETWLDFSSLVGGDEWKQQIDAAIQSSIAALVLLTPESVASPWVQYEYAKAIEHHCPIVPLKFRDCVLPKVIEKYHFLDFQHDMDAAFKNLERSLITIIMQRSKNASGAKPLATPMNNTQVQQSTLPSASTQEAQLPLESLSSSQMKQLLGLVVEDVESYQDVIRDLLVDLGMTVHVAGTRNEAISLIRQHQYTFITLDMQLGPDDELGQDGVFLLGALKRYQEHVPVVMITSLPFDKNKTREFFTKYGIKDMLDKPFDQEELRSLIKKHTSQ